MGMERMDKLLATTGLWSRKEVKEMVRRGRVKVNGAVISKAEDKADPEVDEIRVDGQVVDCAPFVYIMMNKPDGLLSATTDKRQKTVIDLLPEHLRRRGLFPVGRLDKDTEGLLLITNDGDLTKKLTHPSYNKKKIYQVDLNKNVSVEDLQKIYNGVELEDGVVEVDDIQFTSESKRQIGIEIHSGRNRVVRRLFESLGYSVVKLDRVYFAGLTKKNLPRGRWRFLTDAEVSMLKSGSYE